MLMYLLACFSILLRRLSKIIFFFICVCVLLFFFFFLSYFYLFIYFCLALFLEEINLQTFVMIQFKIKSIILIFPIVNSKFCKVDRRQVFTRFQVFWTSHFVVMTYKKTYLLIISFSKHITLRQNLQRSDQFVAANLILRQVFEAKAQKQKQHVKSFQIRYCHLPIGSPHAKTCLRAYADSISAVWSGPWWSANRIHHETFLYNFDPLKPQFYIVKLGFTMVYIIFLISAQKHRLWVLVRTASARRF